MTTTDRVAGLNGSVGFKAPCRVATTAAITLSGEQTIDGVAIVAGDRVLVKNQASGVDNGIYIASTGAWSRALDFDGVRDARNGTLVYVTSGSANGGDVFAMTATDPVTVGTTSLSFSAVLSLTAASAYIQTLFDDADAATARTTLGLGSLATLSAVGAAQITDGTVGTAELADQNVTLAKLSRTGATAGYVLTGNGAGSDPSWQDPSMTTTGTIAQTVSTFTGARVVLSGTIPYDDTIPQSGEGTEAFTRSITPGNASSTLIIEVTVNIATVTAAAEVIVALFQDSTANALAAVSHYVESNGGRANIKFTHVMTAGTTSATTFKVRAGASTASGATAELNSSGGGAGARRLGGVMSSGIVITEILP
jgi:hypothetical protein